MNLVVRATVKTITCQNRMISNMGKDTNRKWGMTTVVEKYDGPKLPVSRRVLRPSSIEMGDDVYWSLEGNGRTFIGTADGDDESVRMKVTQGFNGPELFVRMFVTRESDAKAGSHVFWKLDGEDTLVGRVM